MSMPGHEMLMPGMLTDEQMKELDQARGKDFDLLSYGRDKSPGGTGDDADITN